MNGFKKEFQKQYLGISEIQLNIIIFSFAQ